MIASSLRPPRRSDIAGTHRLTALARSSRNSSCRLAGRTSDPSGTGPPYPGSRNAFHHLAGILFLMFF